MRFVKCILSSGARFSSASAHLCLAFSLYAAAKEDGYQLACCLIDEVSSAGGLSRHEWRERGREKDLHVGNEGRRRGIWKNPTKGGRWDVDDASHFLMTAVIGDDGGAKIS